MKDINDILAMAQNVQNELQKAQDSLDTIEVEGAAGGGLVKVKASAKGRIIAVAIDDSRSARPKGRCWRIWSPPRSTTRAPRPTPPLPPKWRR